MSLSLRALVCLLLATGCAATREKVVAAAAARSLFSTCPAERLELPAPPGFTPEFTVLQLNDVYRVGPVRGGRAGGLSRVAALVERTRQEGRPVYVLHAGDFLFPSLESELFEGRMMVDALNHLDRTLKGGEASTRGELLVVPGNHEFEKAEAGPLVGALRRSEFRWVASNVELTGEASEVSGRVERDALVRMGGMTVGLFALTTAEEGLAGLSYARLSDGYRRAAQARIEDLERRGAEVILGLTHLRMTDDVPLARELQRAHPKLLWIAGGHDHSCMYSPGPALVTKGDANAVRIWRVDLGRDGSGAPALRARMLPLTEADATSPDYDARIWEPSLKALEERLPGIHQPVGRTRVALEGREQCIRNVETNLGNYLTDLMRAEAGAVPPTTPTLAMVNGGLIRIDDRVEGALRGDFLERTLGFKAPVCRAEVKGSDIEQLLEYAVSGNPGEGRFVQVSGLRFTFTRHRRPGARVTSVEVGDASGGFQPLEKDRTYVLMTLTRILQKVWGEKAAQACVPGRDLKELLRESLGRETEGIAPRREGRITELEGAEHCPAVADDAGRH